MRIFFVSLIAIIAFVVPAAAQVLSEKQISLALATSAAQAAMEQCRADGYKVSVAVVDRAGQMRVFLRDDGSGLTSTEGSRRKAYTAAALRGTYAEITARIASNPLIADVKYLNDVIMLPGGVPIKVGNEVIGAIGVGGAPNATGDEACANAGVKKIADQLK